MQSHINVLVPTLMMFVCLSDAFIPSTNMVSMRGLNLRENVWTTCVKRPLRHHYQSTIIRAALSEVTMPALSSTMKEGCIIVHAWILRILLM
jgi:hypothetical protein